VNVEDLLALEGGRRLVGSSYQPGSAGLYLIDTHTKTFKAVALSIAAQTDPRYPCAAADLKSLVTHGLEVAPGRGGLVRVYAVNHGGRESVEVFRLNIAKASAEWVGCVVLPPGANPNSVAALADGGLVITKFLDNGDKEAFQHILAGKINGVVYRWAPGKGFSEVPGSRLSGDNGIVVSRDGKWVYVCAYGSHEIYRLPLAGKGARTSVKVEFNPDNLRWAPDGSILATGQFVTPENLTAKHGWATVRVDPQSLQVTPLVKAPGLAEFDDGTTAVQIGKTLWFGTFRGDRVAYRTLP
jgi:DNA-binding beta-propeller fold protein YncE